METISNHGEKECLRNKYPGFNFRLNCKFKYKIIQIMKNTITWTTFAQCYSHLILRFHIDSLEIWMGFEKTVFHIISLLILAVDGSAKLPYAVISRVNSGPGYGLVPSSNKPLPGPLGQDDQGILTKNRITICLQFHWNVYLKSN